MIIKWGVICAILVNVLFIFGGFTRYFSNFGSYFLMCSLIGFVAGVVIRKWIVETFWM